MSFRNLVTKLSKVPSRLMDPKRWWIILSAVVVAMVLLLAARIMAPLIPNVTYEDVYDYVTSVYSVVWFMLVVVGGVVLYQLQKKKVLKGNAYRLVRVLLHYSSILVFVASTVPGLDEIHSPTAGIVYAALATLLVFLPGDIEQAREKDGLEFITLQYMLQICYYTALTSIFNPRL